MLYLVKAHVCSRFLPTDNRIYVSFSPCYTCSAKECIGPVETYEMIFAQYLVHCSVTFETSFHGHQSSVPYVAYLVAVEPN